MGDAFDDLLSSLDELKTNKADSSSSSSNSKKGFHAEAGGFGVDVSFGGGGHDHDHDHGHDHSGHDHSGYGHSEDHGSHGGYDDHSYGGGVHVDVTPSYDAEPIQADFSDNRRESLYISSPPPPPPVYNPPAPSYSAPKVTVSARVGGGGGGGNQCGKCGSDVGGEHIKAMDRVFHVHHFTCDHCNKELRGGAFYVQNGQPTCTNCVERSNPCSKCGRGITGQYMYSPHGEKWHLECVDRKSCAKCHGAVVETEISALGKHWHPHCFVCDRCNSQLVGNFVVKEGKPMCQNCSNASRPACGKCGQALSGEYVTFKGENLHNHCHLCALCRKPLGVSGFYEVQGQARCGDCVHK